MISLRFCEIQMKTILKELVKICLLIAYDITSKVLEDFMVKKKEFKPIMVEVINPEALGHASELVTQYFYKKYLEMRSMEVRVKANED